MQNILRYMDTFTQDDMTVELVRHIELLLQYVEIFTGDNIIAFEAMCRFSDN